MYYPWQKNQWRQLWQAKQAQRLPHALLLSGTIGMGKAHFAETFTYALLCTQVTNEGISCQQCHACRLIKGRTHPNVMWLEPEKPGHAIKVDQVREVSEFIQQSGLQAGMRIVLINPANEMNAQAANALLKTLEEPTPQSLLMLITHYQHRLPATIISRCQRIAFNTPNRESTRDWLQLQLQDNKLNADLMLTIAQGAPLKALSFADEEIWAARTKLYQALLKCSPDEKQSVSFGDVNPIKVAEELQDIDLLSLLNYLICWTTDLAQLHLNGKISTNHDYQTQLQVIGQHLSVQQCIVFMNYLQRLYRQVAVGINRNKQLLIESILINWQMLFREAQHVPG